MKRLLAMAVLVALVGSCSLTAGAGFVECAKDSECANDKVCLEHYCVKLVDDCQRGSGSFDAPDRIVIAATLPLSVPVDAGFVLDETEVQSLNAYTLALDDMNGYEGVNGRPFALLVCDTHRDTDTIKSQVSWLVQQLQAPMILTSGSRQTLAAATATAALDAGTLIMSATATSPALLATFVQSGGLVWRTAPPDTLQAKVLADLLLADSTLASTTRIGIISVRDPYGDGLSNELSSRLRAGGRTVYAVSFDEGKDILAPVSTLASNGVKATVVIALGNDARRILEAGYEKNLKVFLGHRWVFTDASKDPVIFSEKYASTELPGSLGSAGAQGAGKAFTYFQQLFINTYHVDPSNYSYTSHSYDAMYLLGLGSAWATSGGRTLSGPNIADGLNHLSAGASYQIRPDLFADMKLRLSMGVGLDVEGNSGSLDFIADAGAPTAKIEIWRAEADGGFSTVRLVDPAL